MLWKTHFYLAPRAYILFFNGANHQEELTCLKNCLKRMFNNGQCKIWQKIVPKVLARKGNVRWRLAKWIVAVRKPHNFPARIFFTECTYNGKLLYNVLISTATPQTGVKSVKTRDPWLIPYPKSAVAAAQTFECINRDLSHANKAHVSLFYVF